MDPPAITRRRFLENAGLGAAALVGAGYLAACGTNESGDSGALSTPETGKTTGGLPTGDDAGELLSLRTPAFWINAANHAFFATIAREQLDEKHGTEWDIEWTTSLEDTLLAIGAGRADFTPNNTIVQSAHFALDQLPVKIVGTTFRIGSLVVCRRGEALEEWGQIRGKSMAVPRISFTFAYMRALSDAAGFELEDEVEIVNVPFGQEMTELQAGNVDYAVQSETDVSYFLSLNRDEFEDAFDVETAVEDMLGIGRVPIAVTVATDDLLDTEPEAPRRILDTLYAFEQIWRNRIDDLVDLMAEPENPANPPEGGKGLEREHVMAALSGEMSDRYGQGREFIVRDFREHIDDHMKILELLSDVDFIEQVPPAEDLYWQDGPEWDVPA